MKADKFVADVRRRLPAGLLLLCVSGGADSMALLHACARAGAEALVVHCDFHLRGAESERDREFVEAACRRLGIECITVHFDVPDYMRRHGVSMEMACRSLRYDAFRRLMRERGCVRMAVAHNSGDNDETMLLNLMRGTGVRGLRGMLPDTGEILRPLLDVSRADITAFLAEIGEDYITDSSNLKDDVQRNFLRLTLLPLLESRWKGVRKALARTRTNMLDAEAAEAAAIAPFLPLTSDYLPASNLRECPAPGVLVRAFMEPHGATERQIREMTAAAPGAAWELPEGKTAAMERDGLHIYIKSDAPLPFKETRSRLALTPALREDIRRNPSQLTAYFAGDEGLCWRTPRPGDRIAPLGMKGSRLVADALRDAGVPSRLRSRYPILLDSRGRVLWIPGVCRSRHCLIEKESAEAVAITVQINFDEESA